MSGDANEVLTEASTRGSRGTRAGLASFLVSLSLFSNQHHPTERCGEKQCNIKLAN